MDLYYTVEVAAWDEAGSCWFGRQVILVDRSARRTQNSFSSIEDVGDAAPQSSSWRHTRRGVFEFQPVRR